MKILRAVLGMRPSLPLLLAAAFSIGGISADDATADEALADRISQAFENLRKGVSVETAHKNFELIRAAKEKAFPFLLLQLERDELASENFQEAKFDVDPDTGKILGLHAPQMGEVALMIIEVEVLGSVPKGFRGYEPFDAGTARRWFEHRKGKPLLEMKLDAARESLEAAKNAHEKKPSAFGADVVKLYSDRLAQLEEQRSGTKGKRVSE